MVVGLLGPDVPLMGEEDVNPAEFYIIQTPRNGIFSSRRDIQVVVISHERMQLKELEQLLVHDKHSTRLDACPHESRANTSKQTCKAFMFVNDFKSGNDAFSL